MSRYLLRPVGMLTALVFIGMAIQAAPLKPSIPAIQFTFDQAGFDSVLAQWGPDGMARFRMHFAFDFPFLACYGLFGYLLSRRTSLFLRFHAFASSLLAWIMPAAAAMDAAENTLHLYFISGATPILPDLYLIAGVIATIKWLLLAGFISSAAYAGAPGAYAAR
ncbi:hypothetical protein [Methylococcus sp. EFPC2]|uniref:hypothetical protein n=1 Tax=Methylococcus sp. EFPC2 TaxID=2812648 RepID=UPI00196811B9|nr:hypothetical protein [Methylococcus sp. EFPC2]QSA96567.1 hypothetical protein JWZ97_15290 [Methylococcus sp. EFPC2]